MMPENKTIIKLIAFLLFFQQVGNAQEIKTNYSLQEALDYALSNNQEGKNARLDMEISDRQVGEIMAAGLPQLNARANIDYNYALRRTFLDTADAFFPLPPDLNSNTVGFALGVPYSGFFGATLDQMIFDGAFIIGVKAAKTLKELTRKDNIRTNIEIREAVSKAYFGVLVNRERYLLIERNFTRVDSLLIDTKLLHQNGFSEKIDVNRVQVQYNNLKVELENYQSIVDLSLSILKFQMGLDLRQPLELSDAIQDIDYFDFELAKNFNYDRRIEYSQMNIRKELNQLDIKNVKSQYIPTLDLVASYGKNTGALALGEVFSNEWFSTGMVGIRASVPLFDGLRKRRIVQQRKLEAEKIENQFDQLRYNIDIEIQQSLANYNREIERIKAQEENMELAREVFDVATLKYKEGVGSNIEVIEADASYKEAQTNYYNALYDALISKIDLQKAYGVL
ncbi:MAG: TolC family protein [Reichenbachiella sp.]